MNHPSAVHAVGDGHETLRSTVLELFLFGVDWMLQLLLLHRSARVTVVPALLT